MESLGTGMNLRFSESGLVFIFEYREGNVGGNEAIYLGAMDAHHSLPIPFDLFGTIRINAAMTKAIMLLKTGQELEFTAEIDGSVPDLECAVTTLIEADDTEIPVAGATLYDRLEQVVEWICAKKNWNITI